MPTTTYLASRASTKLVAPPRPFVQACRWVGFLLLTSLLFYTQARAVQAAAPTAPLAAPCTLTVQDEASLQAAIVCVNAAGAGTYTITFAQDISLSQPLPVLTNPAATQIVLTGNGHVLDAQGHGRVLAISLSKVLISGLTLRGGQLPLDGSGDINGGGLLLTGAHGDGSCTLTLLDSVLDNNEAHAGGAFANFCDSSVVTVTNTSFTNNHATLGGAIYIPTGEELFSELHMTQSTVTNNRAETQGGGIFLAAGDAGTNTTITDSTIAHNTVVNGPGGGLSVRTGNEAAITNLTLRNVAIISNTATAGAGLQVISHGSTNVTVGNTTLSGNQASSGPGGGVWIEGVTEFDSTNVRLFNTTIAHNTATAGAGIYKLDGLLTIVNTLVAANPGGDCQLTASPSLPNRYVSDGYNLDSDGSCLPADVRQASDLPNGTANVGPLADNGGPTLTHALLTGSQAIDAGSDAACAAEPVNGVDQRGVVRPQGAHCDIGAYEATATPPPCALIAHDEASLQAAITCVNNAGAGTHTISVTNDISLTQPSPLLTNPAATQVTIEGNGHTIDASGHSRVLTIESIQNLLLHNLTLAGGNAISTPLSTNGGGLSLVCGEDVVCNWHLLNTVVRNNRATAGGGIEYYCAYHGAGNLLIEDSVIRDNQAEQAGGGLIYSSDEESFICSVTVRHSLFEGNQATEGGAIRLLRPRVTIVDSTLRNNSASENGGGLLARISDGFIDMTMRNSTVSGNHAGLNGGGFYVDSPDQTFDFKLINSTFSSNTVASGAGGGLYLRESNNSLRIALINSTVAQNSASQGGGVHIYHVDNTSAVTSTLRLTNTLIAANQGSDCANEVAPSNSFNGQGIVSYGHNLDSDGTCLTAAVRQSSDLPNGNAHLGPLADNGGPTFTQALLPGSQAIDAGDDAVCAADPVNGVDQRGITRPQGAHCDIGAYEAAATPPPPTGNLIFVSSSSSGKAGDVKFRDEDILAYDPDHNTWQMIFDGSDVGITKDVNAFHFLPDGSLLLSFNGPTDVPGLGKVDDSDIVHFIPTELGNHTAGSFAWYLRGKDVGLTTDGEDIDAIGFTADGHLVISTIGDFNTPTASGKDEDLFQLNNATFGDPSSGTWSQYFDGSQVGLANEDVNSLWIDPTKPDLYLTVKDSFAFDGQQIDGNDIFICTLSQTGTCTYRLFWDAGQHNYSAKHLDGIDIGSLPPTFNPAVQVQAVDQADGEDPAADDDIDDLNLEELTVSLFLPVIKH